MTGNTATSSDERKPTSDRAPGSTRRKLLTVAEGLHVLNQRAYAAILDRDRETVLALARQHLAFGAQALAVNLGPGRAMAERTGWVTETLCQELAAPLFLSVGGLTCPELLLRHGHLLTINAVTADPAILPRAMATARDSGAGLVVLLVRPGLTPVGSADRLALASEVIDQALRADLPLRQLYLDPVLSLRPDPHAWRISRGMPDLAPVAESIEQLDQLGDVHTIVALGNCDPGGGRRSELQARVLAVLVAAGLDAVIVNGRDPSLLRSCRDLAAGELPEEMVPRAA